MDILTIIVSGAYTLVYCAVAWIAATLFLRVRKGIALYLTITASVLPTAINCTLLYFEVQFDTAILVCLVLTLLFQLQDKHNIGNAAMMFVLSAGGYSLLSFAGSSLLVMSGYVWWSYVLAALIPAGFVAIALALRDIYPATDWRDYFDMLDYDKQIYVTGVHLYAVLTIGCLPSVGLVFVQVGNYVVLSLVAMGFAALYWVAVYAVCIMAAYRREKLATVIEKQYREEMQSFMNIIRSQRHDYNFHLQALSGIIRRGDVAECQKYLDSLVEDSAVMNQLLPVKDAAVSALINSFRVLSLQKGAQLHVDMRHDLSGIATDTYETNKVLGNLLQNALDEVASHKDKSFGIHLYVLKRGEFCVVRVANKLGEKTESQEEYLSNLFTHGYTTKYGHEGIGLSGVRSIVQKHKGALYVRMEGDIINMVAKIPIIYREDKQ